MVAVAEKDKNSAVKTLDASSSSLDASSACAASREEDGSSSPGSPGQLKNHHIGAAVHYCCYKSSISRSRLWTSDDVHATGEVLVYSQQREVTVVEAVAVEIEDIVGGGTLYDHRDGDGVLYIPVSRDGGRLLAGLMASSASTPGGGDGEAGAWAERENEGTAALGSRAIMASNDASPFVVSAAGEAGDDAATWRHGVVYFRCGSGGEGGDWRWWDAL
nr:hypothetical protein Iba_chr15aCG4960 [Ipomoea batatas]